MTLISWKIELAPQNERQTNKIKLNNKRSALENCTFTQQKSLHFQCNNVNLIRTIGSCAARCLKSQSTTFSSSHVERATTNCTVLLNVCSSHLLWCAPAEHSGEKLWREQSARTKMKSVTNTNNSVAVNRIDFTFILGSISKLSKWRNDLLLLWT